MAPLHINSPCFSLQVWSSIIAQTQVAMLSPLLRRSEPARVSEPPSPRQSSCRQHISLDITSVMQDGYWTRASGNTGMHFQIKWSCFLSQTMRHYQVCSFIRYPIVFPRDKCAGDLGDQPGVRSYGLRPADERYDVYCYIDGLKGEKTPFSFNMKVQRCMCNAVLSFCPIEQHYPTFSAAEFPVNPVLYPLPRNSNQGKQCLLLFWLHNGRHASLMLQSKLCFSSKVQASGRTNSLVKTRLIVDQSIHR